MTYLNEIEERERGKRKRKEKEERERGKRKRKEKENVLPWIKPGES